MQKYILIFMVFFYNWSYGQQFPVKRTFEYSKWFTIKGENQKKGDYFKDTEGLYNPYVGTWIYRVNDFIFILKFQKVKFLFARKDSEDYYWYMDRILSTFKIIKNNIVLVDNLNEPIINTFYGKDKKETDKYGSFQIGSNEVSLVGELENNTSHAFSGKIYPAFDEKNNKNFNKLSFNFGLMFNKNLKNESNPLYLLPASFELFKYKGNDY